MFQHQNIQAILIVCLSYLGFSISDTISKMLATEYNVHQILIFTSSMGMIVSGVWLQRKLGWKGFIPPDQHFWHVVRSFCVAGIPLSVISALRYMPMAEFYGIVFCAPFMILILSALFLKEPVGIWRWLAVAVGFIGVIIIAGPEYEQVGFGLAFAFSAAFFGAASVITVRKVGPNQPRPYYIFYPFCAILIVNLIALPLFGEYHTPELSDLWKFVVLIMCVMISQLGFAIGHTRASEAGVTAPFLYTQIIWGIIFGWLVFGDVPATTTWIGLVIVIGAGLFSIWREWKLTHSVRVLDIEPPR